MTGVVTCRTCRLATSTGPVHMRCSCNRPTLSVSPAEITGELKLNRDADYRLALFGPGRRVVVADDVTTGSLVAAGLIHTVKIGQTGYLGASLTIAGERYLRRADRPRLTGHVMTSSEAERIEGGGAAAFKAVEELLARGDLEVRFPPNHRPEVQPLRQRVEGVKLGRISRRAIESLGVSDFSVMAVVEFVAVGQSPAAAIAEILSWRAGWTITADECARAMAEHPVASV